MSGFSPEFDAAGSGTRDGSVPAPGSIDGRTFYLRADRTWAVPVGNTPGPQPPAPGPDLNQWACNVAGYLTYEVARIAVKLAVDWVPVSWIGDIVGGIAAGVIRLVLAEDPIIAAIISDMVFHFVSDHIVGLASDALTALLDDVLWAKVHCALYSALADAPTDFLAALSAAAGVVGAFLGYPAPATAAIAYFLQHLGITDVANIPVTAFIQNYNCSTCATTGIGPQKPLLQSSFDLTVTDGTTADTFVDSIQFAHATVSGTSPNAIHTPDTATASAIGISRPDNATVFVDPTGRYTAGTASNLNQYGSVDSALSGGATISGLVVGQVYALQNFGPNWYASSGTSQPAYSWQASRDGGATWQDVLLDDPSSGHSVSIPTWAVTALFCDTHHARVIWVATTTSVKIRAGDAVFADNHGTLGWELLDITLEPSSVQVQDNGTAIGTRPALDFADGVGITWTVTDDATNHRVIVTPVGGGVGPTGPAGPTGPTGPQGPGMGYGTLAARPAPGTAGNLYYASDTDLIYRDSGAVWSVLGLSASMIVAGQLATARGGTGVDASAAANGALLIGTGGGFALATLTGGAGISVTNGSGSVVIAGTGSGGGGTALTLLGSVTLGVATNVIEFLAIPGSYTSLEIVLQGRCDQGANTNVMAQFSADTGSNYDWYSATFAGGSTGQTGATGATSMVVATVQGTGGPVHHAASARILIPNYAATTFYKEMLVHGSMRYGSGTQTDQLAMNHGYWLSTAAVTAVTLFMAAGNLIAGSTATLYGVS